MAEILVAADLVKRGYGVALPWGEDNDFDLLFWRPPSTRIERVQVKYTESDGCVVIIRARSQSLTNGRVKVVKKYTAEMIDWLAVYDATTDQIFYLPARELGSGMHEVSLRLVPARNNQRIGTRWAGDYRAPTIEAVGGHSSVG